MALVHFVIHSRGHHRKVINIKGDQMIFKKWPNFSKSSQNNCQAKKGQNIIFKVDNTHIEQPLNLKIPTTNHVLKLPIEGKCNKIP
jgi:hypothetical protein